MQIVTVFSMNVRTIGLYPNRDHVRQMKESLRIHLSKQPRGALILFKNLFFANINICFYFENKDDFDQTSINLIGG